MFNDFKLLNFDTAINKLRKLKDIFDRLNLDNLENRYNNLLNKLSLLDTKVRDFQAVYQDQVPPIIPPTGNLPDLAITGMSYQLFADYTKIQITITNVGLEASPATSLDLLVTDYFNNSTWIPALEPSESFTTNAQISYDASGDLTTKQFFVEVNSSHSFNESSFTNNIGSIPIELKLTTVGDDEYLFPPDGETYLIIHVHNPEGKEIAGLLEGMEVAPELYRYDNSPFSISGHFWYANHSSDVRGTPFSSQGLPPGTANCTVIWNGIEVTKLINVIANSVTEVIFTLPRTIYVFDYSSSKNYSHTFIAGVGDDVVGDASAPIQISGSRDYHFAAGTISADATVTPSLIYLALNVIKTTGALTMRISNNAFTQLPITITSKSFINWHSQAEFTGDNLIGFNIKLTDIDDNIVYLSPTDISLLPANIAYKSISFDWAIFTAYDDTPPIIKTLTSNGLKLVSVQYDLLGTAV